MRRRDSQHGVMKSYLMWTYPAPFKRRFNLFNNFVEGKSNQLGLAAAVDGGITRAVAVQPTIFIYSGTEAFW